MKERTNHYLRSHLDNLAQVITRHREYLSRVLDELSRGQEILDKYLEEYGQISSDTGYDPIQNPEKSDEAA